MPQPLYAPRMRSVTLALLVLGLVPTGCSDASGGAAAKADAGADAEPVRDAAPDPDAGPSGPSFCATVPGQPFFCADFDDGAPVEQTFRTVSGAAKIDQQSLHVVADATDVFVEHDADPSPQWARIELSFALRIEAASADARAVLARIGQHQTDAECRVELEVQAAGLGLIGTGASRAPLTKTLANGTRARIGLVLDATGDGGNAKGMVTVDGQPAIAAPIELGCARLPGPPRVSLGRVSGAGSVDVRYDDVVFDGR